MDVQPITQGHMLVVPRAHAVLMSEVEDSVAMRSFRVARRLGSVVRKTLGAAGVNLFVADGEAAFQDGPHFHREVIPRYANDRFCVDFPAKDSQPPSRAERWTAAD